MDTKRLCPSCQKPLAPNVPMGLCPECLIKAGFPTGVETDTGSAKQPAFVPPTVEEIAKLFPQLEILELVGKGGMGAVYKARQKQLNRFVALKILPPGIGNEPAFAERFTREAQALAQLNHPGIVTLYEFGETSGQFYFLMEFVDGVNLRQLLASSRVSPREALAIVPQICDALQFAHDQGIVHRDIKPENILMDRRGRVKVADFGLAKIVEPGGADLPVSREDEAARQHGPTGVMGTPNYMAPEQMEHPADVDNRADIYALGVVFYQMLTGELPGKKIEPPSSKVQIDVRLDEIVLRALEKKPELRYQQVSEVKTCVETIVATPGSAGVPPAQPGDAPGIFRPEAVKLARDIRATLTPKGLVWFARKTLLWSADQVLLLFDFRAKPQRFTFWSTLLLFCSNIGFIVNGLGLAIALVQRLLNGTASHGNIFVLSVQEHRMFLWMVFCAVGRLTALSMGSGEMAGAESGQTTDGIRSRRVIAVIRTLLAMAALVLVTVLASRWLAVALGAASPAAIDNAAGVAWLVLICVAVFAAVAFWFLVGGAWRKTKSFDWANLHAKVKANIRPTLEFWQAMESGNFAQSWDAAAPMFQRSVGKEEWVAQMEKIRHPLGKVLSRQERSTKFAPDGSLFDAVYLTSFDTGRTVVETVSCAVQSNGEMRVISYYIRPAEDESNGFRGTPAEPGVAPGLAGQTKSSGWPYTPGGRAQFSPEVREIYEHMTADEKRRNGKFGAAFGIWNAATFFLPMACVWFFPIPVPLNWIISSVVLLVGLAFYPLWWRKMAALLCDTAWAKERNRNPATLRIFPFGSTGIMLLAVVLLLIQAALWWQIYEPPGIWLPYLSQSSIPASDGKLLFRVTDVSQHKQIVLVRIACEPALAKYRLLATDSGPGFELRDADTNGMPNMDCLIAPDANHSVGKVLAGSNGFSGKPDYLVGFVLPDDQAATKAVEQVNRYYLAKSNGLTKGHGDLPLFSLRRRLGNDANGKPVFEQIWCSFTLEANSATQRQMASNLSFGPVVERVIQARQTGTNSFLNLNTGELLTPPPDVTNALAAIQPTDLQVDNTERRWQGLDILDNTQPFRYITWLRESGADLMFNGNGQIIAFEGDFAIAHGASSANWDDWSGLSPEMTRAAVETIGSATRNVNSGTTTITLSTNSVGLTYTTAQKLFSRQGGVSADLLTGEQSSTWFFKTREGSVGILQITGLTENALGVKVRYKLVQ